MCLRTKCRQTDSIGTIGVYRSGRTIMLAGDNLHPVAAAEAVVKTHAPEGIVWPVLAQETAVSPSTKGLMSPEVW